MTRCRRNATAFLIECLAIFVTLVCTSPIVRGEVDEVQGVAWKSQLMHVPLGFPMPAVPADNPLSASKISLGRRLFFDMRLSSDQSVACATCHRPERYFADDVPTSRGVHDQRSARNSPSLLNSAYSPRLFWDGRVSSLEQQALYPIIHPQEMNMTRSQVVRAVEDDGVYRKLIAAAFGSDEVTLDRVVMAIATFERTLLSGDSPFDRFYFNHDVNALSSSALRGWNIFRGRAGCIRCHVFNQRMPFFTDFQYHNTGVSSGAEHKDFGRFRISRDSQDRGRFKTPSLRNVAETAPYMHDGSRATLSAVLDHYVGGGGANPYLDPLLQPLHISDQDRNDIVSFLQALTGELPQLNRTEEK
jgi:cytochrome c peroxidase